MATVPTTTQARTIFDAYISAGAGDSGDALTPFVAANNLTAADVAVIKANFYPTLNPNQVVGLLSLQAVFGTNPWAAPSTTAAMRSTSISSLAARFTANPPTRPSSSDGGKTVQQVISSETGTLIVWVSTASNLQ